MLHRNRTSAVYAVFWWGWRFAQRWCWGWDIKKRGILPAVHSTHRGSSTA